MRKIKEKKKKKLNVAARKKELHTLWSKAVRLSHNYMCQWCAYDGKINRNALNHAHHIVAQSLCGNYGRFEIENGMTLCFKCHIDRIKSQPDEYVVMRDDFLKKRNINYFEMKQKFNADRIFFDEEFYETKKKELNKAIDIYTM